MAIDLHSHLIPQILLQSEKWGLTYEEDSEGVGTVLAWGLAVAPVGPNLFSPDLQLAEMDRDGLEKKLIALPPFLFGYHRDKEWAVSWSRASNDALAAVTRGFPHKFIPFGSVALQDPETASEEMRRCLLELGFPGLTIGTNVGGLDLDHQNFTEFFETANRLGCLILIHPNNVMAGERLSSYYLRNLLGNAFETTTCLSRLLSSGFFEKHPKIKICFSHGGGAFPYLLGRLQKGGEVRPELGGGEAFDLPPNVYFDTVVHDQQTLQFLAGKVGMRKVVLGSDYPFDMGQPDPAGFVAQAMPKDQCQAILKNNAEEFLQGE
ncbi:MAG: amidohydrolase [Deltaproteobacteria bacterium]|nr:amidohydrolase [Deltaproteobacteria bacterium]